MDKKIQRLIDGSSELSRHFGSKDEWYWIFTKKYIAANSDLEKFLLKNKEIQVSSLFKKEYPDLGPSIENYKVPLAEYEEDEILIHNSVRYILYYFCIFLLKSDLQKYCHNVRNTTGLRHEDKSSNRFSYPYLDEFTFREIFLKDVEYPQAISNLVSRSFYIKSFLGNRQFLNLEHIEILVERSEETYDYSKLELE